MEAPRLQGLAAAQAQRAAGQAGARGWGLATGSEHAGEAVRGSVNCAVGKLSPEPLGWPRRLEAENSDAFRAMLLRGVLAFGFPMELWTFNRFAIPTTVRRAALNCTHRLIKAPKLYWCDAALAMHLAGETESRGAHLENLILADLLAWRAVQVHRPARRWIS